MQTSDLMDDSELLTDDRDLDSDLTGKILVDIEHNNILVLRNCCKVVSL